MFVKCEAGDGINTGSIIMSEEHAELYNAASYDQKALSPNTPLGTGEPFKAGRGSREL